MKYILKSFFVLIILFFVNTTAFAWNSIYSKEYLNEYKKNIYYKTKFYPVYYNVLNITPEQYEKIENIQKNQIEIYTEKFAQIEKEVEKYHVMKDCNLNHLDISSQKKLIKKLYKDLSDKLSSNDKNLKNNLTREQKNKYKMIIHLENFDRKKGMYSKNLYKKNPKMTVFGNIKK